METMPLSDLDDSDDALAGNMQSGAVWYGIVVFNILLYTL